MEEFYTVIFAVLTAVSGILELVKRGESKIIKQADFKRFQNNYLAVYCLMMGT